MMLGKYFKELLLTQLSIGFGNVFSLFCSNDSTAGASF